MSSESNNLIYGEYGPRTLIRVSGADAVSYLHNLCTQDIRALREGQCAEAFVTSVQGKTLGYLRVYRRADDLLLETSPGQGETLIAHFERYHIREKVEFENLSGQARSLVACWDLITAILSVAKIGERPAEGRFLTVQRDGIVLVANKNIAGDGLGYLVFSSASDCTSWIRSALELNAVEISSDELESRRIFQGTIEFGKEVSSENLPQELARDAIAISFTKGCYLGQETVARIDAMGHVNRVLVRLQSDSQIPVRAGDNIMADEKSIGSITSAAKRETHQQSLAYGFVRRGLQTPGTLVHVNGHPMKVLG
jgi:folate-binding protein YgfZ